MKMLRIRFFPSLEQKKCCGFRYLFFFLVAGVSSGGSWSNFLVPYWDWQTFIYSACVVFFFVSNLSGPLFMLLRVLVKLSTRKFMRRTIWTKIVDSTSQQITKELFFLYSDQHRKKCINRIEYWMGMGTMLGSDKSVSPNHAFITKSQLAAIQKIFILALWPAWKIRWSKWSIGALEHTIYIY